MTRVLAQTGAGRVVCLSAGAGAALRTTLAPQLALLLGDDATDDAADDDADDDRSGGRPEVSFSFDEGRLDPEARLTSVSFRKVSPPPFREREARK